LGVGGLASISGMAKAVPLAGLGIRIPSGAGDGNCGDRPPRLAARSPPVSRFESLLEKLLNPSRSTEQ